MTEHGQSAVLVMAAGAGTRMRSDIPKVLHTLAGRSMLSHVLHSVAKVAPQHLVVVLGHVGFYPRFGFAPAAGHGLGNEYDASDAFMVLELRSGVLRRINGLVKYAAEFAEAGC